MRRGRERMATTTRTTRNDEMPAPVVALHGGTLRYESEPGRGTTVKATLPTRLAAGAGAVEPPAPGSADGELAWPAGCNAS